MAWNQSKMSGYNYIATGYDYGARGGPIYGRIVDHNEWFICNVCKAKVADKYRKQHLSIHKDNSTATNNNQNIDNMYSSIAKGWDHCHICEARVYDHEMQTHIMGHRYDDYLRDQPKPIPPKPTTEQLIETLTKSFRDLGYEIEIHPAIAFDRKGYQITVLEPKENADVQAQSNQKR